jgi:pantetheine-phosphate adenylyltransferase
MEKLNRSIAVYAGTFDGITLGHLDIIRRGAAIFEKLIVAVARNVDKQAMFSASERADMIKEETNEIPNVSVTDYEGLTMDFAETSGAGVILRGIRVISDFEYELQMALMNREINPRIETLFMFPASDHLYISSSLIREVLLLGGDVSKFVPPSTQKMMKKRFEKD